MMHSPLPQENLYNLANGLKGDTWVSLSKAYDRWFYEHISKEYFLST